MNFYFEARKHQRLTGKKHAHFAALLLGFCSALFVGGGLFVWLGWLARSRARARPISRRPCAAYAQQQLDDRNQWPTVDRISMIQPKRHTTRPASIHTPFPASPPSSIDLPIDRSIRNPIVHACPSPVRLSASERSRSDGTPTAGRPSTASQLTDDDGAQHDKKGNRLRVDSIRFDSTKHKISRCDFIDLTILTIVASSPSKSRAGKKQSSSSSSSSSQEQQQH